MENKKNKIYIFDTTLRDGEQAPGIHLNTREKLEIAQQVARLNVDTIEAGFPISSKGDFYSVKEVSAKIRDRKIAALARANFKDIDAARTDPEFLCRIFELAIKNGARIINIPDTVGYAIPDEFGEMIDFIFENTAGIENVILSGHCHNDLGLAVANSLVAIKHGVRQIECAVNGLGERAGNASLEEIAMIIDTRKKDLGVYTDIKIGEIMRTSSIVKSLTGYVVAPNKAIVGKNAFSHEAGIHQDGMLKDRSTYEIIKPEDIGLKSSKLVLGKHSGRHAFAERLTDLGIRLDDNDLEKAFERFKDLADKKGAINDQDIRAIAENEMREVPEHFLLKYYEVRSGSDIRASSRVGLEIDGKLNEDSSEGDGPVDASFKAIDKITKINAKLMEYKIEAVSGGKDALGSVRVVVSTNGTEVMGSGISTDIVEASIKAYIDAMNRIIESHD